MPYQSDKQRRFFEGCKNNPEDMGGKCPPKKVLTDFHNAEYHKKAKAQKRGLKDLEK